ncbi:hypothetical protein FQR65_LT17667 [Abscondita terminalis]|nr:hypothetical protein FQR65_LT17667 [Abscondita terminalis]
MNEIASFRVIIFNLFLAYSISVTTAQVQVQVGAETAMAWYKYCRDVATKIAWHDFRQLGGPETSWRSTRRIYSRGSITAWYINHSKNFLHTTRRRSDLGAHGNHSTGVHRQELDRTTTRRKRRTIPDPHEQRREILEGVDGDLKKANGFQVTEGYIGEWMYRKKILDECENLTEKFFKFPQILPEPIQE